MSPVISTSSCGTLTGGSALGFRPSGRPPLSLSYSSLPPPPSLLARCCGGWGAVTAVTSGTSRRVLAGRPLVTGPCIFVARFSCAPNGVGLPRGAEPVLAGYRQYTHLALKGSTHPSPVPLLHNRADVEPAKKLAGIRWGDRRSGEKGVGPAGRLVKTPLSPHSYSKLRREPNKQLSKDNPSSIEYIL